MRRLVPLLCLALSLPLAGTVSATVVRTDDGTSDPVQLPGYNELRDQFPGGSQALPYGVGNPAGVLDHARGMSAVAGAIATLEARGYIRRPAADVAGTERGFSFACIAFEKPGSAMAERQPLLIVATRAYEIPNVGFVPTTQLYAAMFRDSAGQVQVTSSPADSAIAFVGELLGTPNATTRAIGAYLANPNGPLVTDEDLAFRYSAYERNAGTWQYHSTTSPEMQSLMSQAYQNTAWNAAGGMITGTLGFAAGPQAGVASVLLNGYVSGLVAWKTFWISHPTRPARR
jgi:hypothetical protein